MKAALSSAVLAAALVLMVSCESSGPGGGNAQARRFTAASWNCEALFDPEPAGTEYAEYGPGSGWTEDKYRRRLEKAAQAVGAMAEGGPDLLVLLELENVRVARDLAEGPLAIYGYRHLAFSALPGAALGLAILSRSPFVWTRSHGSSRPGGEAPRPLLEARLDLEGLPVYVFAAHWKSKLGGEAETEVLRRASALSLARRAGEIAAEDPGAAVIALGDLNENWDEFYRRGGEASTALLPDEERAAEAAARDGEGGPRLVVCGEAPPRCSIVSGGVPFYTPWPSSPYRGSYAFRGAWETIDQALAGAGLFDGAGWEFADFRVAEDAFFLGKGGYPAGYDVRSGEGCSDHLPIVAELTLKQ